MTLIPTHSGAQVVSYLIATSLVDPPFAGAAALEPAQPPSNSGSPRKYGRLRPEREFTASLFDPYFNAEGPAKGWATSFTIIDAYLLTGRPLYVQPGESWRVTTADHEWYIARQSVGPTRCWSLMNQSWKRYLERYKPAHVLLLVQDLPETSSEEKKTIWLCLYVLSYYSSKWERNEPGVRDHIFSVRIPDEVARLLPFPAARVTARSGLPVIVSFDPLRLPRTKLQRDKRTGPNIASLTGHKRVWGTVNNDGGVSINPFVSKGAPLFWVQSQTDNSDKSTPAFRAQFSKHGMSRVKAGSKRRLASLPKAAISRGRILFLEFWMHSNENNEEKPEEESSQNFRPFPVPLSGAGWCPM
ncbi:hypothetical protein B0H17DRAFT_1280580 [Mycena rosella]|uniref:Uncharacterized protein n=1 Tax=Mycena rosella TaxID=1033263 RepID=A0AAD7BXU7_MYCRO|nr:hypothetical protein B0H17DRAFT_1280580 [Mycena rosella]